jgi:serine/threonine-protein kinase
VTTSLPDDVLRAQLRRIELLYAAGAVLWTITLLLDIYLSPNGDRGPHAPLIEGAAALLAACTVVYARFGPGRDRRRIEVGVALVVGHAVAIALLNSWMPQPLTSRPISGITLLLLLFGMIAPAPPRQTLVIALVAASMDPLGVWLAYWRGLPVPPVLNTFAMFHLNYACAVLAVVPADILYRLGREITKARALGSYQLIEPIGRGGMGEVWIGRHRLLARTAAIKIIRPDMLNDRENAMNSLRRFELEAQATAALTSPHTIRVYDFGISGSGAFYYVMELLDGRDLESLVRTFGPLPPARVLHIVRQICSSLAEAHAVGLIHRDIKPANVFTCRMGVDCDVVKVLDFGLVKHEQRATAPTLLTSGQLTMGTPAYMAPEVILGDEDVDRRVDIYALGCVAYFLLTGEQVFEAPSPMKLLMQHVSATPLPPSRRAPYPIAPGLDRTVMSCLNKDPAKRPAGVDALMKMLDHCGVEGTWTPAAAQLWWNAHLPDLSRVAPNQTRVSASEYRAGAASDRAPLLPSIY